MAKVLKSKETAPVQQPQNRPLPLPLPLPRSRPNAGVAKKELAVGDNLTPPPQTKKMKWGEPTWFLFHCLAEKVKPDKFAAIRVELLDVINTICNNLPCPDCAKHATDYMKNVNFNVIQTREHLKNMLFVFHNTVNKRKGVDIFPESELDIKYSAANLLPIIDRFMYHFEDKHYGFRMIANDFHRRRIAAQLRVWFQKNLDCFYY